MKTTVSVRVLQPFEWKGQTYHPDQTITLTPLDAIVLSKKRHVTLTKRKVAPEPPPPVVEPEPPKRRSYRRRDVQADEIAPLIPVQHSDPEVE